MPNKITYGYLQITYHTCLYEVHISLALRYKPAGRGFDSWWCHWNFSVT